MIRGHDYFAAFTCLIGLLLPIELIANNLPPPRDTCQDNVSEYLDAALKDSLALPTEGEEADKPPSYASDLGFPATHLVPDIVAYYGISGCWDRSQKALGQMEHPDNKVESHALLSIVMAEGGFFDNAIKLADELPRGRWRNDAKYHIANALIRSGQLEKAREVLGTIPPSGPYWILNESELVIMQYQLPVLIKSGRISEAERYVAEEVPRQSNGLNIFLIMAEAYFESGNKISWAEYLRKAEHEGLKSRHDAFRYYAKWDQMKKARQAALKIKDDNYKIQALISLALHVKSRDKVQARRYLKEARKFVRGCQGSGCEFVAGRVAEGYAEIRDYRTALQIVKDAYSDNTTNMRSLRSIALQEIISKQANNGDLRKAEETFQLLPSWNLDHGREPIAIAQARQGDFKVALHTTMQIRNEAIVTRVITAVAVLDPPIDVIKQWLDYSRTLKYRSARGRSYQVLLAALARAGNSEMAKEFITTETSGLPRARGFLGIAQGLLLIKPGDSWLKNLEI